MPDDQEPGFYLIGIRSKLVKAEKPSNPEKECLWDLAIESTAFEPREETSGLCLSLSAESCTDPAELADRLHAVNGKSYRAVAKFWGTELEDCGFSIEQDDTPWKGHTNACLTGNNMSKGEIRRLAKKLKFWALDRGVIVFNC